MSEELGLNEVRERIDALDAGVDHVIENLLGHSVSQECVLEVADLTLEHQLPVRDVHLEIDEILDGLAIDGGDAIAASDGAEPFGRGRLDVDPAPLDCHTVGHATDHAFFIRRHFGSLGKNGGIQIDQRPAFLFDFGIDGL